MTTRRPRFLQTYCGVVLAGFVLSLATCGPGSGDLGACPVPAASGRSLPDTCGPHWSGDRPISDVLPGDYASYTECARSGDATDSTDACLLLLSKTQALLAVPGATDCELRMRRDAYRAAWELCLQVRRSTGAPAARQRILVSWNHALTRDDEAVAAQVRALDEEWDRALLTEGFWRLLARTERTETLAALCYVIYRHGTTQDGRRLTDRLDTTSLLDHRRMVQNSLNWLNYRLNGKPGDPGPAALAPSSE